jgi:predicted outer membrane protein
MKLKGFSMLALSIIATTALAQVQPSSPIPQPPAQGGSQPGGQQGSQPSSGQPGQPASPSQLQQGGGVQPSRQQNPRQQQAGQQQISNFRGDNSGSQMIDGHLAACLILANEEEVALGNFASQRATGDQVKKFAQQMIEDHTKASQQLRQFAPQGATLQLTSSNQSGTRQDSQGRNETSANRAGDASSSGSSGSAGASSGAQQQMLAIERDAKQECLDLTQKELGEKRGEEFDHAYLGQQMVGHVQMVANLTAFEKHASPELQKVISEQRQTAQQHLDHIKQLKQSGGDHSSIQHAGQQPTGQQ